MKVLQFVFALTLLVGSTLTSQLLAQSAELIPTPALSSGKMERTREILNNDAQGKIEDLEHKKSPLPGEGGYVFKMVQALGLCIGVLLVGAFVIRKINPQLVKSASRKIKIIERTAVSPRTALVLAELDGKSILFSVGSERVSLLIDNSNKFTLDAALRGEQGEA